MKHVFWILALFLAACSGDDSEVTQVEGDVDVADVGVEHDAAETSNNPVDSSVFVACDDETTSFGFEGTVFADEAQRGVSEYTFVEGPGLGGVPVRVVTGTDVFDGVTCDDGRFRVRAGISPFFVDVMAPRAVTTANDTAFLVDALAEGDVNMVVFGDSIPVYGPVPWFPNVLRDKFKVYGDVTLTNVAIAGTRSLDWKPGTHNFEQKLRPELSQADLVVFSLGGNDLRDFAEGLDPANISERIGELTPLIDEIETNLAEIISEVRVEAPNADIVWILYPNYARTEYWGSLLGDYQGAGITLLNNQLTSVRRTMSQEDIVLADMLAATKDADLDALLSDPLHLSVPGHAFYAAEIFKTLGGVETDAMIIRRSFAVSEL